MQSYGLPLNAMAQSYCDRLLALPELMQWYEAALAEPWRESAHEAAVLSRGKLVMDYRLGTSG